MLHELLQLLEWHLLPEVLIDAQEQDDVVVRSIFGGERRTSPAEAVSQIAVLGSLVPTFCGTANTVLHREEKMDSGAMAAPVTEPWWPRYFSGSGGAGLRPISRTTCSRIRPRPPKSKPSSWSRLRVGG